MRFVGLFFAVFFTTAMFSTNANSEIKVRIDSACIKNGFPKTFSIINKNRHGFFKEKGVSWGEYISKTIENIKSSVPEHLDFAEIKPWSESSAVFLGGRMYPRKTSLGVHYSSFIYSVIENKDDQRELFHVIPIITKEWASGNGKDFLCYTGHSLKKERSLNIAYPLNADPPDYNRVKQCLRMQVLKLACIHVPLKNKHYVEKLDKLLFEHDNKEFGVISKTGARLLSEAFDEKRE